MNPVIEITLIISIVCIAFAILFLVFLFTQFKCPYCGKRGTPVWDHSNRRGGPDKRYAINNLHCSNCGQVIQKYTKPEISRKKTSAAASYLAYQDSLPVNSDNDATANQSMRTDESVTTLDNVSVSQSNKLKSKLSNQSTDDTIQERETTYKNAIRKILPGHLINGPTSQESTTKSNSTIEPPKTASSVERGIDQTQFEVKLAESDIESSKAIEWLKTETVIREGGKEAQVTLLHRRMQLEIAECLKNAQIPGRSIYLEASGIDILVEDIDRSVLIEIKTGDNLILVIREAIGQLLEYRHFCQNIIRALNPELLLVSPLNLDSVASAYLISLQKTYNLRINYVQYVPGSRSFSLDNLLF